ncbi:uncharacterized protein MKZ38_005309 [Zalerion maritima]|uniref:Importin N-terminal domain-containing protein n=1 Tax=Zalerion maritima TaxID=339359 RepID=A0AAD5RLF0_9PEZI|nr:uncharacterized protein MKZ38_005309 [Zalerion maritima]
MASNGASGSFAPADVMAALTTLQGSDRQAKTQAHTFLEKFQKSKDAWTLAFNMLQSDAPPDAKHFAAITLKGKISLDLRNQVAESDLPALRTQLVTLLKHYSSGPKAIRIQLAVCLAHLAIQMTTWKDVLPSVVGALGDSAAGILDFLQVLPEEVNEGRKINLSEDELSQRTTELISDNAEAVLQLLVNYAKSSESATKDPQLMRCISSWLREIPVHAVVTSPLLDAIFAALKDDDSFPEASDALSTIFRETREIDDDMNTIAILFPRLMELRPRIETEADEIGDTFKMLTRIFAEAGEAWVILIVREPKRLRPLVEAILECCARDKERDAIEYTFRFWDEFKQYLVLEHYIEARLQYVDVYSSLVDVLLKHLEYPRPDSGNERDLFDGDRVQEEKFREFRHQMGDTLKDSCEVMGVADCLTKVLDAIKIWMQKYASQATTASVPHWQELEAPIFAMRAMGRMVNKDESVVLPQLIPLLVQIPHHEKLRFAIIMVLGRYTEWTAEHSEYLEPQFTYIVSSFESDSKEIVRAAAMSIKFFCLDCKHLLTNQVIQLQQFYDQILDKLPEPSQEEITEGVATVVSVQPVGETYKLLKLYCDPVIQRLMDKANKATDNPGKYAVADHLQLITLFVQIVMPYVGPNEPNPAVKYWAEVFPVLATIVDNFQFVPILERVCRCWRNMVVSYRTAMAPILPEMANKIAAGFNSTHQGCFLWATGAILREFSEDREHADESTTESIYGFFEAQVTSVLRTMSDLDARDAPDVIEDFFRLLIDALLYYPHRLVLSPLFEPTFEAAISSLALEQREPLCATLHYIRDVLTYGGNNPASSQFPSDVARTGPQAELKRTVKALLLRHGEPLIKQILAGMMITFPRDCFADGSGVLLGMFELLPAETTASVERTIYLLPEGTVSPTEAQKLMAKIKDRLAGGDIQNIRQVRTLLQDFTNSYRRRYVAPRDGLGALEASRFHFSG